MRGALSALLGLEPDLEVVAEVGSGLEVLPAVAELRPDVALLDVEMPGMDGITAAALVREQFPATRVLIVTTFGRPGFLHRAMKSGASGFVVKDTPARHSSPTRCAACTPGCGSSTRCWRPTALAVGESPLTARETDVLQAARDGSPVATIARRLFLSGAPCATTSPAPSARPARVTGPRPCWSPRATAGSERAGTRLGPCPRGQGGRVGAR